MFKFLQKVTEDGELYNYQYCLDKNIETKAWTNNFMIMKVNLVKKLLAKEIQ